MYIVTSEHPDQRSFIHSVARPDEHDTNLQHTNRCRHVPDEECMRSIRVPPDRLQVRLPLIR